MFTYSELDKTAIHYDLKRVDDGWSLMVTLPSKVSNSDNARVVNWMRQYKQIVDRQHPKWYTAFRVMDCGYALHIQPRLNASALMNMVDLSIAGEEIKDFWGQKVECA